MAHPLHHAESSAHRYGGVPADYQAIHDWFEVIATTKLLFSVNQPDRRQPEGGRSPIGRRGGVRDVSDQLGWPRDPVRWIGERHVREDCRRIPSLADWLGRIEPAPWMANGVIEDPGLVPHGGDPAGLWRAEVAAWRTALSLAEWMAERQARVTADRVRAA